MVLCLRQGRERSAPGAAGFLWDILDVCPSSSWVNALATLTPHQRTALDLGWPQPKKRHNCELCLIRAAETYTGRTLDLCRHRGPIWYRTPLLWDKSPGIRRRKGTHLRGTEAARGWPSGLPSSNLRSDPAPERAVMATEKKGSPTSHTAQALVPPFPAQPPKKVIAVSTTWRKMWLAFISNPALTSKALDTHILYRDAHT